MQRSHLWVTRSAGVDDRNQRRPTLAVTKDHKVIYLSGIGCLCSPDRVHNIIALGTRHLILMRDDRAICTFADTQPDGWTLVGQNGGFVAQHEHTILVTDTKPIVLTASNGIWEA